MNPSLWQAIVLLAVNVFWLVGAACAGITYNTATGVIRVVDYPSDWPCTPERIYAMDQASGWGKVTYDAATDTYVLDAALLIGDNDRTETYFQLGSVIHPKETLAVKGDVVVYPYWIAERNPEKTWYENPRVNRLTLGVSTQNAVTATLKIFSAQGHEHALYTGVALQGTNAAIRDCAGGQLYVFNSAITALIPDEAHAIGGGFIYGRGSPETRHVLDHAVLSRIAGNMTYGFMGVISNTVFENGGSAISCAKAEYTGLTLRNLNTAVWDNGSLDLTLVDCVFSNNNINWSLAYSDKGLTCIDCTWSPPRRGDEYRAWDNPHTKKRNYPRFVSKRHVVVTAADGLGKPVRNARVTVAPIADGRDLVENGNTRTGASGQTPGRGEARPILLTEVIKQATDKPNQPADREYVYAITVQADGFQPATVKNFRPTASWQRVNIILKK